MNDLLNRLIILSKAELQLVGIFFRTQFPFLGMEIEFGLAAVIQLYLYVKND